MTMEEKMALAHELIHIQGDVSYKELAARCGVSYAVIARLFNYETGESIDANGYIYYASGESLDKIIAALSRKEAKGERHG